MQHTRLGQWGQTNMLFESILRSVLDRGGGWSFRFKANGGSNEGTMIADQSLTDHFTLYQLTHTDHAMYLDMNRQIDDLQICKLQEVARLLENAWLLIEFPLMISSGYRCPALNQAVGSTLRSQHLLCEAADVVPKGVSVEDAFKRLRQCARDGKIKFGQMIFEKSSRGYSGGITEWLHISLSTPYRSAERCGQILTMNQGNYNLLETIRTD